MEHLRDGIPRIVFSFLGHNKAGLVSTSNILDEIIPIETIYINLLAPEFGI
jgi:hypothetical protein